ncbi:aminotransferase class V-fold PLP-dependent enzyme [Thalassotalea mangrovi]|uniref:Aminotransferase class V-fold PLP-dependent enzyme n=1 Tax=Thalassotalea mangrovi TaxID=2572245 RepID=A0A4U1B9J1_9GAMM|nr:aminotransferase class V-fold PLP-dependent enzyme [Thalassotalea mangrovi]TKB47142.1 aminotransferase class V-fold PLP-dependent enzyme [Thalassotalea mangrovi]
MSKADFHLPDGNYLLNHSVGRPLKSLEQSFQEQFFAPWQRGVTEPWGQWLGIIDDFTAQLSQLFNSDAKLFCPQVNLSSGLTKILHALPALSAKNVTIVMTEQDFPSMGFAIQQSLPNARIRYIPETQDVTDSNVWHQHLTNDVDLVFISHAYSNSGQLAPIADIISLARDRGIISILDIAQSAGVIPLDLSLTAPDFMIGSSVKWLCSGPGAAYLWINEQHLDSCQPVDVGWFSHENPFEFDIHHFKYHPTAMRFWGGTPSIAPYAIAAHTLKYFNQHDNTWLHHHNQQMLDMIWQQLGDFIRSPQSPASRSGTAIMHFNDRHETVLAALAEERIAIDSRALGIRVSPHVYNQKDDVQQFIQVVKAQL